MTTLKKVVISERSTTTPNRIIESDEQGSSFSDILTMKELAQSQNIRADFFLADVHVPNSYAVIAKDELGNDITEPIWDDNNKVYKEFEMISVYAPNKEDGPTITTDYVKEFHIKRWPDRYKAFKAGLGQTMDGTDLAYLTTIPKSIVPKLIERGIFTIEQLARESNPSSLVLGGTAYQEAARKYLTDHASDDVSTLQDQFAEMQAQNAEMQAQIKELLAQKASKTTTK